CSLTQCASIGSLPRADSDWFVRVELDNARISARISARRSGDSGDMLINVIDAADLKLCLLGLSSSTAHHCRLRVYNHVGTSLNSNFVRGKNQKALKLPSSALAVDSYPPADIEACRRGRARVKVGEFHGRLVRSAIPLRNLGVFGSRSLTCQSPILNAITFFGNLCMS